MDDAGGAEIFKFGFKGFKGKAVNGNKRADTHFADSLDEVFDFFAVDVVDAEDDEINLVMFKVVESFGSEFFKFEGGFRVDV